MQLMETRDQDVLLLGATGALDEMARPALPGMAPTALPGGSRRLLAQVTSTSAVYGASKGSSKTGCVRHNDASSRSEGRNDSMKRTMILWGGLLLVLVLAGCGSAASSSPSATSTAGARAPARSQR